MRPPVRLCGACTLHPYLYISIGKLAQLVGRRGIYPGHYGDQHPNSEDSRRAPTYGQLAEATREFLKEEGFSMKKSTCNIPTSLESKPTRDEDGEVYYLVATRSIVINPGMV